MLTRQTGSAVAGSRREFSGSGASSAPIQTVTVVGSGLMGSGIAQVSSFSFGTVVHLISSDYR